MNPTTVSMSIGSSGFSAAITVIGIWLLSLLKIDVPAEVAAAFGTVLTSAVHYLVSRERAPKPQEVPK